MKNFKLTDEHVKRCLAGALGFIIGGTCVGLISNLKIGDKDQSTHSSNISTVEEEFRAKDLIVAECANADGEENLYILKPSPNVSTVSIYDEYHNDFTAWYNLHASTEEHNRSYCPDYVHINNGDAQPLFNYLAEDEIKKISDSNGIITTSGLDAIQERIQREYKEKNKKSITKKLSENSTTNTNN